MLVGVLVARLVVVERVGHEQEVAFAGSVYKLLVDGWLLAVLVHVGERSIDEDELPDCRRCLRLLSCE